ncbi:hypothetical protein V2J09_011553, partial [Rumex salicifolius]
RVYTLLLLHFSSSSSVPLLIPSHGFLIALLPLLPIPALPPIFVFFFLGISRVLLLNQNTMAMASVWSGTYSVANADRIFPAEEECPQEPSKTGLLSLSLSLLWLVCLMLAKNARDDYFEEIEEARKGE